MNILCATDKNFLNPTYVTVNSLIVNHKGIHINFYILLNADVSDSDKIGLSDFIKSKGHSCTFYDVDQNMFKNYVVCEKFPKSAYYRLLAHTYLPESVERILYLDVDIVVNKNIFDDLYNLDFNDKYLIVTSHNPRPDFFNKLTRNFVNFESAGKGEFFNSGVLLMNINKFRNDGITIEDYNRAYNFCVDHNIEIFYDQGLLNFMFFDKVLYLSSMDFNFRYSIPKDYVSKLEPNRDYKKAIIHYTGMKQPYKPWDLRLSLDEVLSFGNLPYTNEYFYFSKDLHELCEIWWHYAETVPVYNEIKASVEIKNKWFRRNLSDFVKRHNALISKLHETERKLKQSNNKQNTSGNSGEVERIYIYQYPDGFKHRLYKTALFLSKPFFAIRGFLRHK